MIATYRTSNNAGSGLLTLLPVSLAAAAAIGAVYQLAVYYQPLVKFNFILSVLAGLGVGVAASATLRLAKCRNRSAALGLGLSAGIAAVLAGHVVAYYLYSSQHIGAYQPVNEYIEKRVNVGWRIQGRSSSSPMHVTGWGVWAVWGLEGLAIVIASTLLAGWRTNIPFCEGCNLWADEKKGAIRRTGIDLPAFTAQLAAVQTPGELVALASSPPAAPPGPRPNAKPDKDNPIPKGTTAADLLAEMKGCPRCDASRFLTLKSEVQTQAGKKQVVTKSEELVTHAVLDPQSGRDFEMLASGKV